MNSEDAKTKMALRKALSEVGRQLALEEHRRFEPLLDRADQAELKLLAMMLLQKRSVDGLNGRRWDAGAHLFFEDAVEALLRSLLPAPRSEP